MDKRDKTMAEAWREFGNAWRNLWETSPIVVVLIVSAVVALLVAFL